MGVTDNAILRQLRTMDSKLDDIRERVGHLETHMTAQAQHLEKLVESVSNQKPASTHLQ